MKTDDLITLLSADARPQPRMSQAWSLALAAGSTAAVLLTITLLRPRSDLLAVLPSWRFLMKFVLCGSLALAAYVLSRRLARPDEDGLPLWLLAIPAGLVVALVIIEMAATPSTTWWSHMVGGNNRWCLLFVPLLSSLPLMASLKVLSYGAPTRPRLAGFAAGLLAGGIGAAAYALHCVDDSPFFVAVWYSLGIAIVSLVGAFLGSRLLRW